MTQPTCTNVQDLDQTVLVVECDPDIRRAYRAALERSGYRVSEAGGYDEAVRILIGHPFAMVLLATDLGEHSGWQLVEINRELGRRTCHLLTASERYPIPEGFSLEGVFCGLPNPLPEGLLHNMTRVTLDYRTMRRSLNELHQNVNAFFQIAHEAIIILDKGLNIQKANETARAICHIHDALIGRSLSALGTGCAEKLIPVIQKALLEKETISNVEVLCQGAEGMELVLRVSVSPVLDEYGAPSGALLVIQDRTRLAILNQGRAERSRFHRMLGRSRKMLEVYNLIENLAGGTTTTLITGESGTGKELVAEALHYQSARSRKPLIKVNCAALPDTLLESELFGHVKGAFTGAIKNRMGRFEMADGGTLFLDEIGDISLGLQARLLRVLQEGEFERVGDSTTVKVDVRLVAATNRDLRRRVQEGSFRADLYYRLNVVEIRLPALRERTDDLPLLTEHFLHKFNAKYGKAIHSVAGRVLEIFQRYPWPGNVRELEHVLEHAVVTCHQMVIKNRHLPRYMLTEEEHAREEESAVQEEMALPSPPPAQPAPLPPLPPVKTVPLPPKATPPPNPEQEAILRALETTHWKKNQAAKLLGLSRAALYRKLDKYGIKS